jgi:serine/threonine-protein kinase
LYLQGRHYLTQSTGESYRRALDVLKRATARDPNFAAAYASLAQAHVNAVIEGVVGFEPEPNFMAAKDAVHHALALDDTLGDAHGIVGLIRFSWEFDWNGGEQALRRGIELSPGTADLYDQLGWLYGAVGRQEEALEAVKKARDLDPITHRSDVGTSLMRAGRYVEALEDATRLIAIEPGFSRAHAIAGWAHLFLGDRSRGLAELDRALSLNPTSSMFIAQVGQAHAMHGDPDRARESLAELERLAKAQYVSPYHFAYVYTGLGELDTAMDWLERAYRERTGAVYGIKGSFLFRPLREHPRFKALLGKMNL